MTESERNESEQDALNRQLADLAAEAEALDTALANLADEDWQRVTAFRNWTVFDVVAHLHLSDHMGMKALEGEVAFRALMDEMRESGTNIAAFARRWLGDIDGPTLRARWRELLASLIDGLAATDPGKRLPWAGPGMKPRMFATARQMETWAHGWEIFDLFALPRTHGDRLKNIATIGVRTFGWTYANRGLPVPEQVPHVSLMAPSGARWTWNEPQTDNRVEGDAVQFCQVVTQVRHVDDTALSVSGAVARDWMAKAQCFAGPPVDPPPPGSRVPPHEQPTGG